MKKHLFALTARALLAASCVSEIREPEEEPEEAREAVFLLDRFGYCKLADPAVFEKNKETLFPENGYAIPCRTDGK